MSEKIDVFTLANLVISQGKNSDYSLFSDITGSDSSRDLGTWSDG
ncbi:MULTISPECIES: hypothetical protein [Photorhabdus]|nr:MULTISPECIES: hypothetical protein [Photorhabdus]